MADINSGAPIRFENGGVITIGGDTVLNVCAGTLRFREPGRVVIAHMDRGTLADLVAGDQRPIELDVDVWYTKDAAASSNVLSKLRQTVTNGLINTTAIVVQIPQNLGANAGMKYTFAKCYLPDGWEFQSSEGETFDRISFRCLDNEATVTIESYS